MGDEQITYRKEQGQCDTCSRMTWVLVQLLGDQIMAKYCRHCEPEEME